MEDREVEIKFMPGDTIEQAVNDLLFLKARGVSAYGKFNDVVLRSDTVTMDSAYLAITGNTKAESDRSQEEWRREYDRKKQEHEAAIPRLTMEWVEKGKKILSEDRWGLWEEMVPIRLDDIYQGMELGNSLEIVEILNSGKSLETAKELIEGQGHSGMSWSLVCSMIRVLCNRGEEFVEYVR